MFPEQQRCPADAHDRLNELNLTNPGHGADRQTAVPTDPGWKTHLRRLRGQLRERRDLLVAGLREHAPRLRVDHVPRGGLHLWVRLPDNTNTDRLVRDCEARGVYVASGHEWFPAEPSGPYLRLNFTGPNPNGFPTAAQTIAAALASQD